MNNMCTSVLPQEAGYQVDLASVSGGKIPLDEASLSGDFLTDAAKKFQADGEAVTETNRSWAQKSSHGPGGARHWGGSGILNSCDVC